MSIKKISAIVLAVMIVTFVFAACSSNNKEETSTTAPVITTDSAVIKDADAISLIKTYTAEELGLDGSLDDYKIMVASSGEEIEGKFYVKVIAAKVSEPDEKGSVNIDTYGQYFISYDGETILVYDDVNKAYNPMTDVHDVPVTQASSELAQEQAE